MEVRGDPDDFMPVYNNLKDRPLLDAIEFVKNNLKNDIPVGNQFRKKEIPKYYKKKYNVQILFRFEMPHSYRLIYTIMTFADHVRGALLIELLTHDEYNKRFGYYKKRG